MLQVRTLETYDVCVCGAGLAGLCLARQLKLEMPELRVALIDKDARPLPSGAHKVGESSIEVGTHYLMHTIGLADYLARTQKFKCGLRWFTGSGQLPLENRTETGSPDFPLIPAMQLDRGVLENDLRQMCVDAGIELIEGVSVRDIRLNEAGGDHQVDITGTDGTQKTLFCRWVVDAMGRRRYLASRLKLKREVTHKASACWWRVTGEWDVTRAVAEPNPGSDWHSKELGRRWYATNHFLDTGYWVWVIPLASHTSVGIVADEALHPIAERATREAAMEWLKTHEPHLARWLETSQVADFLALKNFAYTSARFYSTDRWALLGEAAMFADPYYSTGSDLIALQNNVITRLIRSDRAQRLTADSVQHYNELVAEYFRGILALYDGQYRLFGNQFVHYLKTMWDLDFLTGMTGKLGFAPHVLDDPADLPELTRVLREWSNLNIVAQRLLRDWAELSPGKQLDRSDDAVPRIGDKGLLVPNLQVFQTFTDQLKMRTARALSEDCSGHFLEFAQARAIWLFKKATADLGPRLPGATPEFLAQVAAANWLNPSALSLDVQRSLSDGLFDETRPPADRKVDTRLMEYLSPAAPAREVLVGSYARVHDCFRDAAQAAPDALAVVHGEQRMTRRELADQASAIAQELNRRGIQGTVAMLGRPHLALVTTLLGALGGECGFVAIGPGPHAARMLNEVRPALVVYDAGVDVPAGFVTASFHELSVRPPAASEPTMPEVGLESRLKRCFFRFQGELPTARLQSITHFSMMNFQFYVELALRSRMNLSVEDSAPRRLVVTSDTLAGQDWLLPLTFGGVLVIPEPGASSQDKVQRARQLATELDAQAVVSGTPAQLLSLFDGATSHPDVVLLALDEALSSAQSSVLSRAAAAVVDSGVLVWGHEDLWPEEVSRLARPQGVLRTAAE
jgi:flavin-dependent dehydrogenase